MNRVFLHQVEDVVESLQLAVDDDLELSLVIQVGQQLDKGHLGHHIQIDGGDLPSALSRRVQDPLQHRQAWQYRERVSERLLTLKDFYRPDGLMIRVKVVFLLVLHHTEKFFLEMSLSVCQRLCTCICGTDNIGVFFSFSG